MTCSNLGVDEPKTPFSQNKFSSSILMTEALFFSTPIPSLCKLLETVSKVFVRSRNLRSPLSSMENGALLLCVGLYLVHSPNYECFLEDNVPHPLVMSPIQTRRSTCIPALGHDSLTGLSEQGYPWPHVFYPSTKIPQCPLGTSFSISWHHTTSSSLSLQGICGNREALSLNTWLHRPAPFTWR